MPAYQDLGAGAESERVQRALYRISEAAHTAPTLQALFSELHAIVGDLMPARNFYIALHDPATDTLSFPYFVDEKDPPPAPRRLRKGLTEYVLRSGQALLDRPGVYDDLVTRGEVESIGAASSDWLGVPLKTGDRTIGVLTAQSYDEGVRYTERDRDILQFVSTQVAMAIERKRGEEALRASEGELRAVFSAMRDVILVLDATGRYRKVAPTNPGLLYQSADVLLGPHSARCVPTAPGRRVSQAYHPGASLRRSGSRGLRADHRRPPGLVRGDGFTDDRRLGRLGRPGYHRTETRDRGAGRERKPLPRAVQPVAGDGTLDRPGRSHRRGQRLLARHPGLPAR